MNEKTTKQIEEMMNQTIGVEVEMNNITRTKAAELAAEFFGTGRHEHTAGRNGYDTYSAWDGEGRVEVSEGREHFGTKRRKCEMVTPILTYADMETLQELIRRLRKAGARATPQGAAEFTFTSARRSRAQTLRNLANIMASHEGLSQAH
ncbi:MAG: amidoligase family protein [Oscillospiraceae bacterium]